MFYVRYFDGFSDEFKKLIRDNVVGFNCYIQNSNTIIDDDVYEKFMYLLKNDKNKINKYIEESIKKNELKIEEIKEESKISNNVDLYEDSIAFRKFYLENELKIEKIKEENEYFKSKITKNKK